MSFMHDLVHGADNKFDHTSLNALQKVTLRAVVMAFLFYGLAAIEGMIMRTAIQARWFVQSNTLVNY